MKPVNGAKKTALHLAAEYGHRSTTQLLLDRGAGIKHRPDFHDSSNHSDDDDALLPTVANQSLKPRINRDINAKISSKSDPIHLAAINGPVSIVQLLLNNGAQVNSKDCNKNTPLHLAAKNNDVPTANLLIDHGADVNSKDIDGLVPIHLAAMDGQVSVVQLLLGCGSLVNIRDRKGNTPLHLAAKNNHVSTAKPLIDHGAEYQNIQL
jgi:ankyrin repeat protein